MNNKKSFIVYGGVEVVSSAVLRIERPDRYGKIEDMSAEELALPDEFERMIYQEEFRPILALPYKKNECSIRPAIDEDGKPNWGAFATVDFEKYKPKIDKMLYKADKLREQLRDLAIMIRIISDRICGMAKYKILRHLRDGTIDLGDISDFDMYQLGRMYLRALRLRDEILKLEKGGWQRKERKLQKWLDS